MRKIICRGRNPKMGWIYGSHIRHETRQLSPMGGDKLKPEEVEHYIARDSFADWNMPRKIELVPVEPETVGQFTGMTDKNRRNIFEGDILKVWDALFLADFTGEVTFHDGSFCIKEKKDENLFHFNWSDYTTEVIGNIHDSPELLEVDHHE